MKRIIAILLSLLTLLALAFPAYADDDKVENETAERDGRRAAEQGYAYLRGEGAEQDDEKALQCFLEAEKNGNTEVLYTIGQMYENGQGTEKLTGKAGRYYKLAAEAGSREAEEKLKEEPFKTIAEADIIACKVAGYHGFIRLEVLADKDHIYDVTILSDEEPEGREAIEVLPGRIVEANSVRVDAVSGATVTSTCIRDAVMAALFSVGFDVTR